MADAGEKNTEPADLLQRALRILNRPIQRNNVRQSPCPDISTEPTLIAPLQADWLVVYRDQKGVLCGGCDDRAHGTVDRCVWEGRSWSVCLTDGQRLPITAIRGVGQTDPTGRLVAAWTVREHGLDGQRDSSDTERATPE